MKHRIEDVVEVYLTKEKKWVQGTICGFPCSEGQVCVSIEGVHHQVSETNDSKELDRSEGFIMKAIKTVEKEFIEFDDSLKNPTHYTQGGIQPLEFIVSNKMSYIEGNIIKYVTRYKYKNGLEDLKKAQVYLEKLIKSYEV